MIGRIGEMRQVAHRTVMAMGNEHPAWMSQDIIAKGDIFLVLSGPDVFTKYFSLRSR